MFSKLNRTPSLTSLSTRVSSTSSLRDLAEPSPRASVVRSQRSLTWRPLRGVLLAALLSLAWLYQRHAARRSRSAALWGSARLAALVSAMLASLNQRMGIRGGRSDFEERPERVPRRQSLICIHPHGTNLSGLGSHVIHQLRGSKAGALKDVHILAADAVFGLPVLREICLVLNMRSASAKVVDKLVSAGKTIALAPGGIHEQLATDARREQLFFPPNLGFVRTAMKYGIPLVAMYNFGENQMFDVPEWSRPMSQWLKKSAGAGFAFGLGRFKIPAWPKAVKVETRFGREVPVGPASASPSDAQVERVFRAYCAELHRLFDEQKAALPGDVAARGLRLVWRGHEDMDLSPEGLANHEPARKVEQASGASETHRVRSRL